MSSSLHFGLLFGLTSILHQLTRAQVSQDYKYHACSGPGDVFSDTSDYATNLKTLLSNFSSLDHAYNGFYNLSVGQHEGQVNSLALCRGDVSESTCLECIKFGTTDLPSRCPNNLGAIIWYDACMFRYTNWYMFRSVEGTYATIYLNSTAQYEQVFNEQLIDLLRSLRDRATLGNSTLKFAVGDTVLYGTNKSENIYALVQCIPDLDQMQCENCLDRAFKDMISQFSGKVEVRVLGASCDVRSNLSQFYRNVVMSPPAPPQTQSPSEPEPATTKGSPRLNLIIVIVASTACLVLVHLICLCLFLRWRIKRKEKFVGKDGDAVRGAELQVHFETIKAATSNFSDSHKLGQGGFGTVYKGQLVDGQEIAVKRLSANSGQGDAEFKNEVLLLAKLQHKNLVELLGFCLKGQERLLIYEFVPNASLDQFLFNPSKSVHLNWERRQKIIKGIARGLLYLHEDSRLRIIHRDLKTSNVLLDANMNPKIADFGMARLFVVDQTRAETNRVVGTYGYMAPEYAMNGQFSPKTDVYSFGVIIMELISGRRRSSFTIEGVEEDLVSYAWESWRNGNISDMFDLTLKNSPRDEILRVIHIGLLCVQESVTERPTMASVGSMISNSSVALPLPSTPAYFTPNSADESVKIYNQSMSSSSKESTNCSANGVSMTSYQYPSSSVGGRSPFSVVSQPSVMAEALTVRRRLQPTFIASTMQNSNNLNACTLIISMYVRALWNFEHQGYNAGMLEKVQMRMSSLAQLWRICNFMFEVFTETHTYLECSDVSSTSAYQMNLEKVLGLVSSNNDIQYGFYNFSEGQGSDKVNELHFVGPDVAQAVCHRCLNFSTTLNGLRKFYPNQTRGIVWYKACMLRYSDQDICGVWEGPIYYKASTRNVSDVNMFTQALDSLLSGLKIQNGRGGRVVAPSCYFRYDAEQFYDSVENILPPSPRVALGAKASSPVRNLIMIVVLVIILIRLALGTFIYLRLKMPKKRQSAHDIRSLESLQYDLKTIAAATDNFSEDNILGCGGFGKLDQGPEIAVKRLALNSGQGDLEFKNEVLLLAKLQHRNLVRLLGFGLEGVEQLLVYEFLPNGSLDQFLFDSRRIYLDWGARYKIIGGIARGLLYLHEDSRLRIIHRDLKASNILLDEELHSKIADFGMARLFGGDQTEGNTSRIVGTFFFDIIKDLEGHKAKANNT
ncbi:unnamed protein product [Rhodiola kirilowii]